MADKTLIEWADATWNPIVGCSVVSPGCTNCYAMKLAHRFNLVAGSIYWGLTHDGASVWNGAVSFNDKVLNQPLSWKRPRRIFVNSMGDLFHDNVPDDWIDRVFAVMALAPQHTFLVLTKRAPRMRRYITAIGRTACIATEVLRIDRDQPLELLRWPLPNVWLGVSAEDQARADERIPRLLETPAAKRFVSCEPLLGPIHLARFNLPCTLDWVIAGGESGAGARPMHPDWARGLRDQCAAAGVPFFFKQWGEWAPMDPGETTLDVPVRYPLKAVGERAMKRVGKKAAGALLDGVAHKAFPA